MTDETTVPDISVVIPCYNAERWVGRAIDSVLAQERVTLEVIVIDDGSTDGSTDVLRRYDGRIHWETGPNRGACAARNRGLALARADYVMFLDADDYVEGPFLSAAVQSMRARRADLAFGCTETEIDRIRRPYCLQADENSSSVMYALLENGFVQPFFWSVEYLRSLGGWKEGLRRYQDYELAFRALASSPVIALFFAGRYIVCPHNQPNRISLKTDLDTVQDQARIIRFVARCLDASDLSPQEKRKLMRCRSYRLWQQTCRTGDSHCMREAKGLYREFGGRGHFGSLVHQLTATLIGLKAKEKIALRLAQVRRRLGTSKT